MKLFIACPSHSGQVEVQFMSSYIDSMIGLMNEGVSHIIKFHAGESAIGRARNHLALSFLESDCDKLLFIDTDLTWTYQDLHNLISTPKEIVGGTYALKGFPVVMNFNPLPEHRKELFEDNHGDYLTNYKEWARTHANTRGEVEVMHVPTGFLLIDRSVFMAMKDQVPWYFSYDRRKKETQKFFDFFQFKTINNEYYSEDWFFCHTAREMGYRIWLQTRSICGHVGKHTYDFGQHVVIGQRPLLT